MLKEFLNEFINNITPGQFEGMVLYIVGAICTTIVKLHYRKQWSEGLKGKNKQWDSYEIMLTILFVFFDHLIMAHVFLGFIISDGVLLFLAGLFLYGFTGRWGLEWLAGMKGTTVIKTTHTETTTNQNKDEIHKEGTIN